jgi:hypothetical protein
VPLQAMVAGGLVFVQFSCTEISFETPGSSIVTP